MASLEQASRLRAVCNDDSHSTQHQTSINHSINHTLPPSLSPSLPLSSPHCAALHCATLHDTALLFCTARTRAPRCTPQAARSTTIITPLHKRGLFSSGDSSPSRHDTLRLRPAPYYGRILPLLRQTGPQRATRHRTQRKGAEQLADELSPFRKAHTPHHLTTTQPAFL